MLHFSCPSFLSFWLTISILKLSILWVREHLLQGSEATTVKFQWNARRASPDPKTSNTFPCIFRGNWGFPSPPPLAPALPLLLLYLMQNLELLLHSVLLLSVEVTGMVSSEVLSGRDDITGIFVTATCQTHGQSSRRAARATCRAKEGEEAAQEPSTALLCSDTAQFLCGDLIYRAASMVTKIWQIPTENSD